MDASGPNSGGSCGRPGELGAAIDEFFLARAPRKHSAHTLAAYRRDFDAIVDRLALTLDRTPAELQIADLEIRNLRRAFAGIAHQSASTIARTWSTWNQLFSFLVAEGVVAGNPMAAVDKPRVPKSRPKAITGDDSVRLLLEVAARGRRGARNPWPERDFAVVVTLLTCGLRLSELLELTLRSIDGPAGERVIGVRGKGNKERTVPLEPEELARTAAACADAGASMIHVHVRDDGGRHSLDRERYGDAVAAIRAAVGDAMLIQLTSEAAGRYNAKEQIRLLYELAPEGLSVSIGLREFFSDDETDEDASQLMFWLDRRDTLLQYILYTPEEVERYQPHQDDHAKRDRVGSRERLHDPASSQGRGLGSSRERPRFQLEQPSPVHGLHGRPVPNFDDATSR